VTEGDSKLNRHVQMKVAVNRPPYRQHLEDLLHSAPTVWHRRVGLMERRLSTRWRPLCNLLIAPSSVRRRRVLARHRHTTTGCTARLRRLASPGC